MGSEMCIRDSCNIDDDLMSATGTQYGSPLSVPTAMSAFLCRIRLSELCREVVDSMPPVLLDSPEASPFQHNVDYELVLDLDTRFRVFVEALPIFFRLDQASMQQSLGICRERPYIAWQRTFLHFGINTRLCHLHRPFHLEGFTNPRYAYSRTVCIQSAQTVLNLRRSMEDVGALIDLKPSRFWVIVQHVFLAAIVLATDVSLAPDAPEAVQRREEVLAACRMLDRSQHESATLKKAIQKNTQALHAILQDRMPTDSVQTFTNTSAGVSRIPAGSGLSSQTTQAHVPLADMTIGAISNGTDFMASELTMPILSDIPTGQTGDIGGNPAIQYTEDQAWENVWSDIFDVGLAPDMSQWAHLMDDMEFAAFTAPS